MAEKRKLFAEMDKVFKKVDEGVDDFQETLKKMQEANSDNQREKFQIRVEDELKREMKKLQRLRDSIKGWQQSTEIKDKEKLALYRRIIETRMEQFKDIERESKTKPHSKQGLQGGLKAAEKVDPVEKERAETIEFLQSAIAQLNDQKGIEVDILETELEELEETVPSSRRRKGPSPADIINTRLARHKHHIHNLELIMRLLNNETLESEQVKDIEDDIEDYIQRNLEDDFMENELMYDDLNLDDMAKELGSVTAIGTLEEMPQEPKPEQSTPTAASPSPSPLPAKEKDVEKEDKNRKSRRRKPRTPNGTTPDDKPQSTGATSRSRQWTGRHSSAPSLSPTSKSVPTTPAIKDKTRPSKICATPPPPLFPPPKSAWTGGPSPPLSSPPPQPMPTLHEITSLAMPKPIQQLTEPILPKMMREEVRPLMLDRPLMRERPMERSLERTMERPMERPMERSMERQVERPMERPMERSMERQMERPPMLDAPMEESHLLERTDIAAALARGDVPPLRAMAEQVLPSSQPLLVISPHHATDTSPPLTIPSTLSEAVTVTTVCEPGLELGLDPYLSLTGVAVEEEEPVSPPKPQLQSKAVTRPSKAVPGKAPEPSLAESLSTFTWEETQEAFILPVQGASPLASLEALKGMRSPEQERRLELIEAASHRVPLAMDGEKYRQFNRLPQKHLQPHYPLAAPANSDSMKYFGRLDPETLFFIFYYMEGTKCQYLAAKALKALSWRFHKKYLVWFQRHEDPSLITDEYEQGTYIYFDYEKWGSRKKESFTFEYQYLEDQELPDLS